MPLVAHLVVNYQVLIECACRADGGASSSFILMGTWMFSWWKFSNRWDVSRRATWGNVFVALEEDKGLTIRGLVLYLCSGLTGWQSRAELWATKAFLNSFSTSYRLEGNAFYLQLSSWYSYTYRRINHSHFQCSMTSFDTFESTYSIWTYTCWLVVKCAVNYRSLTYESVTCPS